MSKKHKKSEGTLHRHLKNIVKECFLRQPRQSYNYKQIARQLALNDSASRARIVNVLEELRKEKFLITTRAGKYQLKNQPVDESRIVKGTVIFTHAGKIYFIEEGGTAETQIEVARGKEHTALPGDTVEARIVTRQYYPPVAQILKVIKRKRTLFTGTIHNSQYYAFVTPTDTKIPQDFYIPSSHVNGAKTGDVVVVELLEWNDPKKKPTAKVIEILGRPGQHETEIHTILTEFGLPYKFPSEVEKAAAAIDENISPEEIRKRRDFRPVLTFTIDPEDAKDFDDALSIQQIEEDLFEVGVHIADVTHYVKKEDVIDREAQQRATSVYLVDRVVPMLPEKLSNYVCSLRPYEDKLTFSVVFEITRRGEVRKTWIGKTIIHSDYRFTYEEVQAIIEGSNHPCRENILILNDIAKHLRKKRFEQGSIAFEKTEVKFQLDEQNEPLSVYFKIIKDAHHLIEEFMLLANRSVTEYVVNTFKQPDKVFVYRVHEPPAMEKLEEFSTFVKQFGYTLQISSHREISRSFNQLLQQVQNKPEQDLIEQLAIRTMAKAHYSTHNIGHYGLAFDNYTHFTSPIRRYPDIMVHRLLSNYLSGHIEKKQKYYEELCKHSSEREKLAMEAERASVKYMQVKYLAHQKEKIFSAIITGVTEWGIYAEIIENKCEGMIPLRTLQDDKYIYDAENYRVIGRKYKKTYRLGDKVEVMVKNINIDKKQIDFELM